MVKSSGSPILLILVNIILGSVGQVILRYGASRLGDLRAGSGIVGTMLGAVKGMFTPYVFLGLCIYAVSSVLWIVVLNQVKLSYAYPLISLSYVFVVILSALLLHERVPTITIFGLMFITLGVSLIGIGAAGK